jgi:hypothetical protein
MAVCAQGQQQPTWHAAVDWGINMTSHLGAGLVPNPSLLLNELLMIHAVMPALARILGGFVGAVLAQHKIADMHRYKANGGTTDCRSQQRKVSKLSAAAAGAVCRPMTSHTTVKPAELPH